MLEFMKTKTQTLTRSPMKHKLLLFPAILLCAAAIPAHADPVGTAFNYQGRLTDSGGPATGLYDFQFVLCDAATNGAALVTNIVTAAPVTNGLYNAALDFGASAFDGNARWLALSVRTNGGMAWTALAPRLALTPTPYALHAAEAGSLTAAISDAKIPANIPRLNGTNIFTGPVTAPSFSGGGSGLSGVAPASGSSNYVSKIGDTITGRLNLPADGLRVGNAQIAVSGGKVGIGTTAPSETLHVMGSIIAEGTGGGGRVVMKSSASDGHQYEWYPDGPAAGALGLFDRTANAYRLMIDGSGSVRVGTTSSGHHKLAVSGGIIAYNSNGYDSEFYIYNPAISSNSANYYKALDLYANDYGISAGVTDGGYRIGLGVQGYVNDPGFQGTLGNQYGIWARHGSYSGSGTINNSYGVYIDTLTSGSTTFGYLYGLYQNSSAAMNYFAGNVGVGTAMPQTSLHVVGNQVSGPIAIFKQSNPANTGSLTIDSPIDDGSRPSSLLLSRGGVARWKVGGIYTSDSFGIGADETLGTQKLVITPVGNVGIGTTSPSAKLEIAGSLKVSGIGNSITTPVLSITGGSDVAEPFAMSDGALPKGAVVVIDEAHPGQLKLSDQAYDKHVAGIVSGAGGVNPGLTLSQQSLVEGGQNVALTGRVYALAETANGSIHPGDLLTTSSIPGHAMKVTDPAQAQGAIIGKAMSRLESGRGLVLVLVTLQ